MEPYEKPYKKPRQSVGWLPFSCVICDQSSRPLDDSALARYMGLEQQTSRDGGGQSSKKPKVIIVLCFGEPRSTKLVRNKIPPIDENTRYLGDSETNQKSLWLLFVF